MQAELEDDILTVLLPEFDTPTLLAKVLHNQSGFRLKLALLTKPGVVVTNVRYHLTRSPARHIPSHLFQEPCPDLPLEEPAGTRVAGAGVAMRGATRGEPSRKGSDPPRPA